MEKPIPQNILKNLPPFSKASYQTPAFEDSTHDIWRLENINHGKENAFLKVCQRSDSPFWKITSNLFDMDLPNEIPQFKSTYAFIDKNTSLQIPNLLATSTKHDKEAYLLASEIHGDVIETDVLVDNSSDLIKSLAQHLAQLHNVKSQKWGVLNEPTFEASSWTKHLAHCLTQQNEASDLLQKGKKVGGAQNNINNRVLDAINACKQIECENFTPVMLDLRWDQFLQKEGKLNALIDLDAFVFAPRELDFVILEYLFDKQQVSDFKNEYLKTHEMPDLHLVREPYRLLLYFMQVLGKDDFTKWMNQESYF